jgi:hypothetical protein
MSRINPLIVKVEAESRYLTSGEMDLDQELDDEQRSPFALSQNYQMHALGTLIDAAAESIRAMKTHLSNSPTDSSVHVVAGWLHGLLHTPDFDTDKSSR